MLTPELLAGVKQYADDMTKTVTFVLNPGTHEKRGELEKFLADIASVSDKITVTTSDSPKLRSAVSFTLLADGEATGIVFSGIPGGHEFTSLVVALLQAGGRALKLDQAVQAKIKAISQPLHFETFVSLSCHNCPDVVQSLNQFALLSPNISNETIDGNVYPELVEQRGLQGVPAVFLDGESFANGKIDTAVLLDKLLAKYPDIANVDAPALPEQDVTVIGGGPAGVAAAIYAARKGLAVTIVADRIGGQVKDTMDIENFISVSKTTGPALSANFAAHLGDYDITRRENVSVKALQSAPQSQEKTYQMTLNTGEVIRSKTVIIATGAKWRQLGIPGEAENIGNGVAYCPHCDGPFFKGKDVAVIGGGNSGVEAALDLSGIVRSVTLFEFMPELKADKVLQDQLYKRDNITVHSNAAATKITTGADGKVNAIYYTDRADNIEQRVELSGVFVQIGLVPNSDFVDGVVKCTQFGEILINEKGETSAAGIFACGDVTTVPYKQIVIAMGEGAKAALAAFDYLLKQG
ncbi:MAG: alkyl hydroperoxide reductase subunit F [Gammaproteobacteria bacterium]|nr:MAG: alkyl hydroperoxide reductase subunit F [Gammaproteobacteria bacterium]